MGTAITIIAFIALFIFIIYGYTKSVEAKKRRDALDAKRGQDWQHDASYFITSTPSVDKIYQTMDKGVLAASGIISGHGTGNDRIFQLPGGKLMFWEATLAQLTGAGGIFKYRFAVSNQQMINGIPQGQAKLDILLTQIEKAVLSLDKETQIQRVAMEYTTETHAERRIVKE